MAQGRRVVGEARPEELLGERGQEDAPAAAEALGATRCPRAGRWGRSGTLPQWPPGEGSLVVSNAATSPPPSVETGLDD